MIIYTKKVVKKKTQYKIKSKIKINYTKNKKFIVKKEKKVYQKINIIKKKNLDSFCYNI